jgi:hypothetical protein
LVVWRRGGLDGAESGVEYGFTLRCWVGVYFSVIGYAIIQFFEIGKFVKNSCFIALVSWDDYNGIIGFECFDECPVVREKIVSRRLVGQFFVYLLKFINNGVAEKSAVFR